MYDFARFFFTIYKYATIQTNGKGLKSTTAQLQSKSEIISYHHHSGRSRGQLPRGEGGGGQVEKFAGQWHAHRGVATLFFKWGGVGPFEY